MLTDGMMDSVEQASDVDVTILIPMAGDGARFRDVGFLKPKPVIDVAGKPMIIWVIENILPKSLDIKAEIIVVLRRDLPHVASIIEHLRKAAPCITVVYADERTEGAACTCLLARDHLDGPRPLLIINSDQFVEWNEEVDSADFWRQLMDEKQQGYDGNILCFKHPRKLGDKKWSYAATDSDGLVNDVREKEVISDNATVGAYYWQRSADFVSAADEMIRRDVRVNGEFYVAPVYNINIEWGQRMKLSFCRRMWGMGVPADLVRFLSHHVRTSRISQIAALLGCTSQDLDFFRTLFPAVSPAAFGGAVEQHPHMLGSTQQSGDANDLAGHSSRAGAGMDHCDANAGAASQEAPEGGAEVLQLIRNLERVKFIAQENDPALIALAVADGFDVKVDVWLCEGTQSAKRATHAQDRAPLEAGKYYLGRDSPQHSVTLSFLQAHAAALWLRCRTPETLRNFASMSGFQYFAQSADDDVVMTSCKNLWAPVQSAEDALRGSAAVVREGAGAPQCARLLGQPLLAISCSDVRGLRKQRDRMLLAAQLWMCSTVLPVHITGSTYQRIELVVFDLDGVLVESQPLHFHAMNQALAAAAGSQEYVISEEEHRTLYDGLSTKQKLNLLTSIKGLPEDLHAVVWQKKQDVTRQLVRETIPQDADIIGALRWVKAAGFPVAVASNCIRESVLALLSAVGVLDLVDAIYSNENVKRAKPDADIYQLVAQNFGHLDPKNVAVFEDSSKGFEAAIRAKCNLFKVASPLDIRAVKVLRRILAFEACSMIEPLVNIVVPMAGNHPTFWTEGPDRKKNEVPVVLSNVRGKPALFWTMQSLQPLPKRIHFIFVVRSSLAASQSCAFARILPWSVQYSRTSVVAIDRPTRGAAQSVLQARHLIDNESPLAIFDGNHRLLWSSGCRGLSSLVACLATHRDLAHETPLPEREAREHAGAADAIVTVFRDRDPRWSYIQHAPGVETQVVAVKEKMLLSDLACSGLYCFKHGHDFVQAALATHAHSHDSAQEKVKYYVAPVLDTMIAAGKRVQAEILRGSSSIRNFGELKTFGEAVFAEVGEQEQQAIYSEMRMRNRNKILGHGFSFDAELRADADPRRCLAAYVVADSSNFIPSPRLWRVLQDLHQMFERHVVYEPLGAAPRETGTGALVGRLHWTFLQLLGFGKFEETKLPADYLHLFETLLLEAFSPFEICFDSLILTPSNLVLVGHPTVDVNDVRESVRECMRDLGYPLLEPYKSDTLHMTLVRFVEPLSDAEQAALEHLVDSCLEYPAFSASLLRVSHLAVSPASWKMLESEIPPDTVTSINFL